MPITGDCENPLALHEQVELFDPKRRERAAGPVHHLTASADDDEFDDSFLAVLLRALSAWST